jgi:hypothetical protein
MAKSKQSVRARVTQVTGRRRKKPTNPVERAFEDVKQLVSDTGERLLSRSGKSEGATKQASSTKTATTRKRGGQKTQAATKKAGAARIRKGQQRQAATKKAARGRGVKTSQ